MNTESRRSTFARRTLALTALLVAVSGGSYLLSEAVPAAGRAPGIEAALPGRVLAHLSIMGAVEASACRNLALADILNEPEVKAFTAQFQPLIERQLEEIRQGMHAELGFSLDDLLALFQGRTTLTLAGVEKVVRRYEDFETTDWVPDVVVTVDVAGRVESLRKMLDAVAATLPDRLGTTPRVEDCAGHPLSIVSLGENAPELHWTIHGTTLIAGLRRETLEGILGRLVSGSPEGSLSADPAFAAVARRVAPKGSALQVHANVKGLLETLVAANESDEDVSRALSGFGLDSIEAAGWAMTLEGKGVVDRFYVHAPGGFKGLYSRMRPEGRGLESAKLIPRDAMFASVSRINIAGLFDGFREMLGSIEPRGLEEFDSGLEEIRAKAGVDLRRDIIANLGEEVALSFSPSPGGGMVPDLTVTVALRDPVAFAKAVTTIMSSFRDQRTFGVTPFGDAMIGYVDVGEMERNGPALKPCWVIHGNWVTFALVPQTLKNVLARSVAGEPSILDNADLQGLRAQLRTSFPGACDEMFTYIDVRSAAEFILDTAIPVLQSSVRQQDVPVDMTLLPRSQVVTRHLFGFLASGNWAADGIYAEYISPAGMVPLLAIPVGAGAFMGVRAAQMGRQFDDMEVVPEVESAPSGEGRDK